MGVGEAMMPLAFVLPKAPNGPCGLWEKPFGCPVLAEKLGKAGMGGEEDWSAGAKGLFELDRCAVETAGFGRSSDGAYPKPVG